MWNLVYVGLHDFLSVDQGTAYTSREFRENIESEGISIILEAPIEKPGRIGIVERHQAPLLAAYMKLRDNIDRSTFDPECLKMPVFARSSIIGSEGLCPILLVYGVIPRPARSTPYLTQLQRSRAIEEAMKGP